MSNWIVGRLQAGMRALLPKEEDFFLIFERGSDSALEAAETLLELVNDFSRLDKAVEEIARIEHEADDAVREVLTRLNSTFVTPVLFDREDLYRIAERMDDVSDRVKGAIDRMKVFKVEEPTPDCIRQAELLARAVTILRDTMHDLTHLKPGHSEYADSISDIEEDADVLIKQALGDLFNGDQDPTYILKWKELYEVIEDAIDACEDTANLVQAVIVKNA